MERTIPAFKENRRAIRLNWKRPVTLIHPTRGSGHTVNVSSAGILFNTSTKAELPLGEQISLVIPHATGKDNITVRGKIVRLQRQDEWLQVAVDLTT